MRAIVEHSRCTIGQRRRAVWGVRSGHGQYKLGSTLVTSSWGVTDLSLTGQTHRRVKITNSAISCQIMRDLKHHKAKGSALLCLWKKVSVTAAFPQ